MRTKWATKLSAVCAVAIVASVSTACSTTNVRASIPAPPLGSNALKTELRSLEGTDECRETRNFLLGEVSPYFARIKAMRKR